MSLSHRIFLAFVMLSSTGAAHRVANAQDVSTDPPPLPAPGKLVDVGGWRLHLNCTGEFHPGQATVILEAGLGDFSVEWSRSPHWTRPMGNLGVMQHQAIYEGRN
jgi:hypothetical protein